MASPNPAGRRGREQETHTSPVPSFSQAGILRRIKRDHPDIAERVEQGEFRSARAAGIAAGFIRPSPPTIRLTNDMPAVAAKLCQHLTREQRIQLIDLLAPEL